MPPSPQVPGSESPVPSSKPRLSYAAKLWITGLAFPTLLLIVAAIYINYRTPQIQLIEQIRQSKSLVWQMKIELDLPWMDKPTFWQDGSHIGKIVTNLPIPASTAEYDWQLKLFGQVTELTLGVPRYRLPDALLEKPPIFDQLPLLTSLRRLTFTQTSPTVEQIRVIQRIPSLRKLSFVHCILARPVLQELSRLDPAVELGLNLDQPLTSDEFQALAAIPSLTNLNVSPQFQLPDRGFEGFEKSTRLLTLVLFRQQLTTDTFRQIAKIKSLQFLFLPDCSFSEDDLIHLSDLPNLKHLILSKSTSPETLERLQQQLPNANIQLLPL